MRCSSFLLSTLSNASSAHSGRCTRSCLALSYTRHWLGERSPLGRAAVLLAGCPPPTASNLDLQCGADCHPSSPFALSGSSVDRPWVDRGITKCAVRYVSRMYPARPSHNATSYRCALPMAFVQLIAVCIHLCAQIKHLARVTLCAILQRTAATRLAFEIHDNVSTLRRYPS
jgi:hypothetical protein